MPFKIYVSGLILLFSSIIFSQTTIQSKYVDLEYHNNFVYAISKTNKLVVWNIKNGTIEFIKKGCALVYKDVNNNIYTVTTDDKVLKETQPNVWTEVFAFSGKPFAVTLTKQNKFLAISSKGVKFNNTYYLPSDKHRFGNGKYSYSETALNRPNLVYVDNKDRVWISYDYGKFSEVFIFDTSKSAFINNKILMVKDDKKTFNTRAEYMKDFRKKQLDKYDYYVKKEGAQYVFKFPTELPLYFGLKSICQDKDGNYYFSQGLSYSPNSGIYVHKKSKQNGFYYTVDHFENNFKKTNEILGIVQKNTFDKSLYYYSNYGFYKLINTDKGPNSELVVDPNILLYKRKVRHEYGHLMNVKKMVFVDDTRFVFLTSQYGFGYFDGENVSLFN